MTRKLPTNSNENSPLKTSSKGIFQRLLSSWLLLSVLVVPESLSFILPPERASGPSSFVSRRRTQQLQVASRTPGGGGGNDHNRNFENDDVESVRERLEKMMTTGPKLASVDTSSSSSAAVIAEKRPLLPVDLRQESPHLTMIGRIRRSTEIKLLEQIKETKEEAADALHQFWQNERGTRASQKLQKADEIFRQSTGSSSLLEAEVQFLEIISEYGPSWVEPLHRLAMLYYLEGRHEEARELEEAVLKSKPWHIGALSHYVRVVEAQEDVETAVKWAGRRLSPHLGLRRRRLWANRAVKEALDQLAKEEARVKTLFGKPYSVTEGLPWQ